MTIGHVTSEEQLAIPSGGGEFTDDGMAEDMIISN
jgi:hypothetical protein